MNNLVKIGRKRTLLISISILLISIYTICFYHSLRPHIEIKKLIQQLIRFTLTILLLVFIYKGKNWAKVIGIILFVLGVLASLFGLFFTETISLTLKRPLIVVLVIYAIAIYHFGFSKSFKAFSKYQNKIRD